MSELTTGITMICLLQFGVIVGCTLFTRTFVRIYQRNIGDFLSEHPLPFLPVFIADFGLWFLLVPIGCALAFVWKPKNEGGEPMSGANPWLHCALWSIAILWLFFGTACEAPGLL